MSYRSKNRNNHAQQGLIFQGKTLHVQFGQRGLQDSILCPRVGNAEKAANVEAGKFTAALGPDCFFGLGARTQSAAFTSLFFSACPGTAPGSMTRPLNAASPNSEMLPQPQLSREPKRNVRRIPTRISQTVVSTIRVECWWRSSRPHSITTYDHVQDLMLMCAKFI